MNALRTIPLLAFVLIAAELRADEPKDYIMVQKGDLPIILTAPHGGRKAIPDVEVRKGETQSGTTKFVTGRDENTYELTQKLAKELETRLKGKPYIIAAKFERKFVDANRPPQDAYEGPKAQVYYETYHKAIKDAADEVRKQWGRGLHLDIHGQAAEKDSILRGTQNGKGVTDLVKEYGSAAHLGPKSLFGRLAKEGFNVFPPVDSKDPEHKGYTGGHTIGTYGSHQGTRIDAIQLEFGSSLRTTKALDTTHQKAASAIEAFVRDYLPKKKLSEK